MKHLLPHTVKFLRNIFSKLKLEHLPVFTSSLAVLLSFYSCNHNSAVKSKNSAIQSSNGSATSSQKWSLNPFASAPRILNLQVAVDDKKTNLAYLKEGSCLSSPAMLRLYTDLQSPFGNHSVRFELSTESTASPGVTAEVDGLRMLLNVQRSISAELSQKLCAAFKSGDEKLFIPAEGLDITLVQWLGLVAPDCDVKLLQKGLYCEPSLVDSTSTLETLTEIRRTMVRSWSRQPYILTRRIAIAISAAEAISAGNYQSQLDALCRVINFADPIELPLAFASGRWQNSVCQKSESADRLGAAQFGLQKALGEIEFLRQLFERTSLLGTLLVRVPREHAPTKDLYVNLSPHSDVSENLALESKSLGAKMSAAVDGDFESPKACWHPLFAADFSSLQTARYLDLTGETMGVSCLGQSASEIAKPSEYLAESITSETEFVITNGQSKMLRLPAGSYAYEIRAHEDAVGWEPSVAENTASSRGEIKWESKRPSAAIKNW